MSAELKASRRDATLILTISNPGAGNLLHAEMAAAAIETLSTAERDASIRAVVLIGAGDVFCAGDDPGTLLERRTLDQSSQADAFDQLHGWIDAIRDCPKPVIAAVEGLAAGSGLALALACDFLVAGATARFALRQTGDAAEWTPGGGGSWLVARSLPHQLAGELLIDGASLDAARLHAAGLVNRLVNEGQALDAALNWADALAQQSASVTEAMKSLLRSAENNTFAQQVAAEKMAFLESLNQPGTAERLEKLLGRRTPASQ